MLSWSMESWLVSFGFNGEPNWQIKKKGPFPYWLFLGKSRDFLSLELYGTVKKKNIFVVPKQNEFSLIE